MNESALTRADPLYHVQPDRHYHGQPVLRATAPLPGPHFIGVTPDLQAARAEALETLASYSGGTRAECMNAVQIIILGLATLDTLGEAKTTEMSPSLCLRFRGGANNINRSYQKTEQILAKRLACDVPIPTRLSAEPVNAIDERQAEAVLQQTQAKIDTTHTRPSGARSMHSPQGQAQSQQDQNRPLWGSAMMETLAKTGMPVQPAAPT